MKYSDSIKPISYLKTHASEVVQDSYDDEQTQESLALLEILAQSSASIERGEYKPLGEAFEALRKRRCFDGSVVCVIEYNDPENPVSVKKANEIIDESQCGNSATETVCQ